MEIRAKCCNPANMGATRGMAQVDWIVIHYTSNHGDTAKNNADYFARETLASKASAHFFVDENEVWSSVPVYRVAYHVGAKIYHHERCRNTNSIGVEICMLDRRGEVREGAIRRAAVLTRWLMDEYGIAADHVLRHYDVTHKNCPAPMVRSRALWERFLEMLDEEKNDMRIYKSVPEMPDWAQGTFTRLVQSGFIAKDAKGEIAVQECSLQPMVYLDRLTGYRLEKLPELLGRSENR